MIAIRHGNAVWIAAAWVDPDTMKGVRKSIGILRDNGLHSGECWGDADGLGKPICDRFEEAGVQTQRIPWRVPGQ